MKCIILCAGYTEVDFKEDEQLPKALFTITNNRTILDYTVEKIEKETVIDEIIIATNNRYVEKVRQWKENHVFSTPITIINDTTNNSNEMLGAVGDIAYTINYMDIKEDLMVVFGDNLFDFSLDTLINNFKEDKTVLIAGQSLHNSDIASNLGVMEVSEDNRLLRFEEKVSSPIGRIKSLGIYLFKGEILPYVGKYLSEGNLTEAPGYFIRYLHDNKIPIYVNQCNSRWFSIRCLEDLKRAREYYIQKN